MRVVKTRISLVSVASVLILAGAVQGCRRREAPPAAGADRDNVVRLFKDPVAVPAFQITDLDGRVIPSSEWQGKVIYVNFWATWCPPCRAEIPDLIALQEKYRDRLVIVGISEDDVPASEVKAFAAKYKMNYPIAMTTPEVRQIFKRVVALPTTFVVDRDGKLIQKHVGQLDAEATELEARVLSGLDRTARVERVEDDEKVRLSAAAEAKSLPGVDLSKLSETQRREVMQKLIAADCTCGCGLTLAECRLDDPSCPVSLPLAQKIAAEYAAETH